MQEALRCGQYSDQKLEIVDYTKNLSPLRGETFSCQIDSPIVVTPDKSRLKRRWQLLGPEDDHVLITADEMEDAEKLLNNERLTGSSIVDIQLADEGRETISENPITAAVEAAFEDPDYSKQNGHGLKHKMIANRKVALLPDEIPDEDLKAIGGLAEFLTRRRGGPIEVAVAHPGAGQSAAAIWPELQEGSHLCAFDCIQTYKFSLEPSQQFLTSFEPEMQAGRVFADLQSRKFPWPHEGSEAFDLVFIERGITRFKLESWMDHVSPDGFLAGRGDVGIARKFAEDNHLTFKDMGEVWAINNG